MYSLLDSRYDFKGPWDAFGKESTECRRKAVRNRAAIINNAYLHAIHNAKVMARPAQVCGEGAGGERGRDVAQVCAGSHLRSSSRSRSLLMQEKSEARWRDYAADNYFHYYYRYGEDKEGQPLAEAHRNDDLLELAAEAVKDLMTYKHYEGGKTITGVGKETGFAFTRRRLGCYCVPAAGESCCHVGWTGELDRGVVVPASARSAATRPSGPPTSFREGIDMSSLLCMPGDEDDETADGESIWFVNALGVQCQDLILPFPLCCRLPASLPCLPLTKIGPRVSLQPQEKNKTTYQCGPCTLVKNHFSVPVEWLELVELTEDHAIFKVWPTEQNRIAVTHLMGMSNLVWEKVEEGKYYMTRTQYDACNEQL